MAVQCFQLIVATFLDVSLLREQLLRYIYRLLVSILQLAMMYNLINFTPESNSPQLICFSVLNFTHPLKRILATTKGFQCVSEMNKFKPIYIYS